MLMKYRILFKGDTVEMAGGDINSKLVCFSDLCAGIELCLLFGPSNLDRQFHNKQIKSFHFKNYKTVVVCCCKLNNTRDCDKHLFGQVSTCTGCYQLSMFSCTNVHPQR